MPNRVYAYFICCSLLIFFTVANLRIDRTTALDEHMCQCAFETLPYMLRTYKSGTSYELRFASSVSPPSTRCPDMAVTPNRRLSCPAPRVLDAHPVYTVFRDVSHDTLTRRSPPSIVRALYGEALAAPYIIELRPEAFHPRPVCLPDRAGPHCPGFIFPTWRRLSVGAKVVGSLTPEVTGTSALDRIDRPPAISGHSKGWKL